MLAEMNSNKGIIRLTLHTSWSVIHILWYIYS